MISPGIYFISKVWFFGFLGGGGGGGGGLKGKNDLKLPVSLCCTVSGTVDHIMKIFGAQV